MKVGVIGAGSVGSACLLSMILRGSAREIVLVNRNRKRAQGVVTDMQYGLSFSPKTEIRAGDYSELHGATLVMVTAGVNEKTGGATDRKDPAGRLRLLETNIDAYRSILPEILRHAPEAIILVLTDPPDPLADFVRSFGFSRVLSSGTYLDSLRFRFHVARRLKIDAGSVEALVVGEHGTSEVLLWSSARIGGVPLTGFLRDAKIEPEEFQETIEHEVRFANITIIEGNKASQFGIGMVAARVAEIILRDERAVIPIGSYIPEYGVTFSLPTIVGNTGAIRVVRPAMSPAESQALQQSAEKLKEAAATIQKKAA